MVDDLSQDSAVTDGDAIHTARATLDAWRASGADRLDPVRFHLLDALTRRAVRHGGETRRVIERRLSGLLGEYTAEVERTAAEEGGSQSIANDVVVALFRREWDRLGATQGQVGYGRGVQNELRRCERAV